LRPYLSGKKVSGNDQNILIAYCLMIRMRHQQPSLWEGVWAQEVSDLWEPWMRAADRLLEDEELLTQVFEAQGRRWKHSGRRGRLQTPAEVLLRLMLLKHLRNWSYEVVEREVRANLVYREFTRIGTQKVPDAKTLGRLGQAIGPEVVQQLHARLVEVAREHKVIRGRRMRVDTTVVETNIHHPTDSSLLGDGARVLTRVVKKIQAAAGGLKTKVRDRMRSVKRKVVAIAIASRQKGPSGEEKRKKIYRGLLSVVRKVRNQAQRVQAEMQEMSRRKQRQVKELRQELGVMIDRAGQVLKQTRVRILGGNTKYNDKMVSVFEPHTEIIRKGKASKPTEFGKMVKLQEAEEQIITHYEVFDEKPADTALLVKAVEAHQEIFGRTPQLVAADAGFYTQANEKKLEEMGVKRVSVPSRNTRSAERKQTQKSRWFRRGQKWRTGCEGRISVLKRRHGLDRCLYRGQHGMRRWVGWGVMADNLIHLGACVAAKAS
jgi:IS5 family transposase